MFLAFRFKAYLKRVLRRKVIWSCSQVSWQKRVTNSIPSLRQSRWAVCLGWFACSISAAVQNFFQMGEVRTFSNIQYWHLWDEGHSCNIAVWADFNWNNMRSMILLIVIYVLHAVKREPKGFEDVHESIPANVSFQDESCFSFSNYEILVLSLTYNW